MASINIRRPHTKSLKDAKAAVDRTVAGMKKKLGIEAEWDGNVLNFSRPGVNGSISVSKQEVHVHAELGFLFGALKPMVEDEIKRRFDEDFGK